MCRIKSYNYNDAIINNRFKDIEKLYSKGHKFHKDNLSTALKHKNIKMFKWFLEKGAPLIRPIFNQLLENQEWDLAKDILLGKIKYNFDNEKGKTTFYHSLNESDSEPFPEELQIFEDQGSLTESRRDSETSYVKKKYNHPLISITTYVREHTENEFIWYLDTMEIAAKHNNLDFILFLKENNLSDWTLNLVNVAAFYNHYSLSRKLVDLGCPVGSFLFLKDYNLF